MDLSECGPFLEISARSQRSAVKLAEILIVGFHLTRAVAHVELYLSNLEKVGRARGARDPLNSITLSGTSVNKRHVRRHLRLNCFSHYRISPNSLTKRKKLYAMKKR